MQDKNIKNQENVEQYKFFYIVIGFHTRLVNFC